jgi:hypothetical protein
MEELLALHNRVDNIETNDKIKVKAESGKEKVTSITRTGDSRF